MATGIGAVEEIVAKQKKRDHDDREAILQNIARRTKRLKDLKASRSATRLATKLYGFEDRGDHPEIRIRTEFIRLATQRPKRATDQRYKTVKGDVDSRPPLTKLINRPSYALPVYLSVLYLLHLIFEPGERIENPRENNVTNGWVDWCGLATPGTSPRELNLRLTRALRTLADSKLVAVAAQGSRNRFDDFTIYREDGRGQRYTVPGVSRTKSITLPAGFFRAGWHLVLSTEELATLLAVAELTHRLRLLPTSGPDEVGVGLSESVRWGWYGLAPEAYASRHELDEFGLIKTHDPMHRNHGKLTAEQRRNRDEIRAPRLIIQTNELFDFERDAIDVVTQSLTSTRFAPRYAERAAELKIDG